MIKQLEIFPPEQDFSAKLSEFKFPIKNKELYQKGMTEIFGLDPQRFVDGFLLTMFQVAAPDVVKLDRHLKQKHGQDLPFNEMVLVHYGQAGIDWLDRILA